MRIYKDSFYKDRHLRTQYSAKKILSMTLQSLPKVESVVDIGCGVGTWLSVLKDMGIDDIQGVDGDWVNQDLLEIEHEKFMVCDLGKEINMKRKYDLAMSLEVAEHLPPSRADVFIESLTNMADMILFSAAIAYQGGKNHLNEQWQDYWIKLFYKYDYEMLDIIRPEIWDDKSIPWWYRQNIFIFVKRVVADKCHNYTNKLPICIVHPDTYLEKVAMEHSVKGSLKLFLSAVREYLLRILGNKNAQIRKASFKRHFNDIKEYK